VSRECEGIDQSQGNGKWEARELSGKPFIDNFMFGTTAICSSTVGA